MRLIRLFLLAQLTAVAWAETPQDKILEIARKYLEMGTITYVYGGAEDDGLDCSHFVQKVYTEAGYPFPYINTALILDLTPEKLQKNYHLIRFQPENFVFHPTDLLVFHGHIAMVETVTSPGHGDIIHSTGGRDIRGPGQGVQRERLADFMTFRGPLLAVLRHESLNFQQPVLQSQRRETPRRVHPKLRQIPHRSAH